MESLRLTLVVIICIPLLLPAQQNGSCLDQIPETPGIADADFDKRFDLTRTGELFSCDLRTRASRVAKALDLFRFGFLYDSEKHIRASVRFPLTATVNVSGKLGEEPLRVRLTGFSDWLAFRKKYVNEEQAALIACSSLHTGEIVKSRSYGFMLGSGMVWFQQLAGADRVQVTAIHLYPVLQRTVLKSCPPKEAL